MIEVRVWPPGGLWTHPSRDAGVRHAWREHRGETPRSAHGQLSPFTMKHKPAPSPRQLFLGTGRDVIYKADVKLTMSSLEREQV